MINLIISGGQTGVDRAALDVAIKLGIKYGGWCPKGRLDEVGIIPAKYINLKEVKEDFVSLKDNYDTRTKYNIRDSDGTLIIVPKIPLPNTVKDGTVLTINQAIIQCKPYLIIDITRNNELVKQDILEWVEKHSIEILNIAGPRESTSPGIYKLSFDLLESSLSLMLKLHK